MAQVLQWEALLVRAGLVRNLPTPMLHVKALIGLCKLGFLLGSFICRQQWRTE